MFFFNSDYIFKKGGKGKYWSVGMGIILIRYFIIIYFRKKIFIFYLVL